MCAGKALENKDHENIGHEQKTMMTTKYHLG